MTAPALTVVTLGSDVGAALLALPASAGVAQILGADDASLVIARAANLRRWAASQLGRGKPRPAGVRPALDLTPVARAIAYTEAPSAFGQRLAFERLMARHVPLGRRRDLKTPAYLHLDPKERFPRLVVRTRTEAPAGVLFGPFRDTAAAGRARDSLHKRFRLRPCDFTFEPHPELALGVACLYAQVHSCAAPCLSRVGEDDYRAIAVEATRLLEGPPRDEDLAAVLPPWVRPALSRSVVVEAVKGRVELYPVRDGVVLDGLVQVGQVETLDEMAARLVFPEPEAAHRDTPWLNAWRHTPKRSGRELPVGEEEGADAVLARIREALSA